jgi:hypothetical protein
MTVTLKLFYLLIFASYKNINKNRKTTTMKKSILIVAFALTTSISIFTGAQAQSSSPANNVLNLGSNTLLTRSVLAEESSVHARVLKSFKRSFKISAPVQWSTDDRHYLAYFTKDGVQNRITYRKNGQMVQSMKSYGVKHLDKDVRSQVEEAYDGYEITGITEIYANGEKVYFVNIESRRKMKEVVAYNGDLMIRRQFNLQ